MRYINDPIKKNFEFNRKVGNQKENWNFVFKSDGGEGGEKSGVFRFFCFVFSLFVFKLDESSLSLWSCWNCYFGGGAAAGGVASAAADGVAVAAVAGPSVPAISTATRRRDWNWRHLRQNSARETSPASTLPAVCSRCTAWPPSSKSSISSDTICSYPWNDVTQSKGEREREQTALETECRLEKKNERQRSFYYAEKLSWYVPIGHGMQTVELSGRCRPGAHPTNEEKNKQIKKGNNFKTRNQYVCCIFYSSIVGWLVIDLPHCFPPVRRSSHPAMQPPSGMIEVAAKRDTHKN